MKTFLAFVLTLFLAFGAQVAAAQQFLLSGKMIHTNLEGGCWYLDVDSKHYELLSSDTEMMARVHVPNAHVTVLVAATKGAMSPCMVGEVVKLIQVQDAEQQHPVDLMVMDIDITGRMHKSADGKWYVQTKKGAKFILTTPLSKYKHEGAHYHRFSRVVHGPERTVYTGTIVSDARKGK